MEILRRDFLKKAGLATMAGLVPWGLACKRESSENPMLNAGGAMGTAAGSWQGIRESFELDPQYIHMAGLLLASHPAPVRKAISEYRRALDRNPASIQENFSKNASEVRKAAAEYMNVQPHEIALTDSTTMGTALLINGIHIREDQEMLTANYDYHVTHQSIEFKAKRSGASYRKIPIYEDIHQVTEDEITDRLIREIRPHTRLLTGTWVHSATGLRIPVRRIADRLAEINAGRDAEDRVLFFVDGVHGFGVEETPVGDLGCDFFSAGTHKWLFGPRGTGILWGRKDVHEQVSPTIPTFTENAGWGGQMSPGGFKAFEHQWAVSQAFEFHRKTGKEDIRRRIHNFARQLKEGLSDMKHVKLYTPMNENLSSGIVCFDVEGMSPLSVVANLAQKNIIASSTPYDVSYARLTPGIYNTSEEMEEVLQAIKNLT